MISSSCSVSLAASYSFQDSFGQHQFERVPERVVVTDWTLVDQLLPLGIVPIGMPEVAAYNQLVGRPELPENIQDIGLRRALNLRDIEALRPDVVILGTQQKFYEKKIAAFSYVNFFSNFSMHYRNVGEKAKQRFVQMAKMFQKQAQGEKFLADFEEKIAQNKQNLSQKFTAKAPNIVIFRFAIDDDVIVYGENSLAGYVLSALGLKNAYQGNTNQYGDSRMGLSEMFALNADYYCYIAPKSALRRSPLALKTGEILAKFTANQARLCVLPKVNSYGGVPAMQYMQNDISHLLLTQER